MMRQAIPVPLMILLMTIAARADWQPAKGPLMTRWAKDVSPDKAHPEYPRPQMVRKHWLNLNGLWDYAVTGRDAARPDKWDGQILVPFPIESALSGVMKQVGPDKRLWYHKRVTIPQDAAWKDKRVLLHFGACDWQTTVWVNGIKVGEHTGGYDPFTFDITDALKLSDDGVGRASRPSSDEAANRQAGRLPHQDEIIISVYDPTDANWQPRGKQVRNPHGIWYTPVTGIWQTVWLEPVPRSAIESVRFTPDIDRGVVSVLVKTTGDVERLGVRVDVAGDADRSNPHYGQLNKPFDIAVRNPHLWSPDAPHLYAAKVSLTDDRLRQRQIVVDSADSYFAMRKIEVRKDTDGFNRLFLNNKPLFQYGPLDQGWWPDGLYTAPTDEALRYDIEMTKKLGFNMARKHVKVEPARWYYWADKLGLMVWQDMPNGDRHIGNRDPDIRRSAESEANFRREWKAIVESLYNHPSIIAWVPFNEGWGQFKTNEILEWTKQLDPTRLVDGPSGWTDRGGGDMHDMHRYPGPGMPQPEEKRAVVLGEFGGLGLPVKGHTWQDEKNWGYRSFTTQDELRQNYDVLIARLRPLIGQGLAAAIYTQTTDVEIEVNGLMTYDRAVTKFDAEHMARLHAKLYEPPPVYIRHTVVPTSEAAAQTWRYTTDRPGENWFKPDFDDSGWAQDRAGFGEPSTPGTVVRTRWKTNDIWVRRAFELKDTDFHQLNLRIHHDEDTEVYINGRQVATFKGYTVEYTDVPLSGEAAKALRAGKNIIAAHCRQTGGGQYIDIGLVDVEEKPREAK